MLAVLKVASASACNKKVQTFSKMLNARANFQQALKARPCARSVHFTVHYTQAPFVPERPPGLSRVKLSTAHRHLSVKPVDNFFLEPRFPFTLLTLGMMVPKRLVRRAVTRNLVKRQIRAAFFKAYQCGQVTPGTWVFRLLRPINQTHFISAKSDLIAQMLHQELRELLQRLQCRIAGQPD